MKRTNLRGEEDYWLWRIAAADFRAKVPHLTSIGNIAGVKTASLLWKELYNGLAGMLRLKFEFNR
jgi:hypothetical protein